MTPFWLITARKDLSRRARDPVALALWLGFPLAMLVLLHLAFGGDASLPQIRVLVVDRDENPITSTLVSLLGQTQQGSLFVFEPTPLDVGRARMDNGDATALMIIPPGFARAVMLEQPATVELVVNPSKGVSRLIVQESLSLALEGVFYAHRILGDPLRNFALELEEGFAGDAAFVSDETVARAAVQLARAARELGNSLAPLAIDVDIANAGESRPEPQSLDALFFPSMLFLAALLSAAGMSEDIWQERTQGTLTRGLTTPNTAVALLGGKILATVVVVTAVSATVLAVARWGMGFPVINLLLAIAWLGFSAGVFSALLLWIQTFAASQRTGTQLTYIVIFPLLIIGGGFFPFEIMPDWMSFLGHLTPNGLALVQFKWIASGNASIPGLLLAVALGSAVGLAAFRGCVRRVDGAFARS